MPQGSTQRASDGSLIAYVARDGKAVKVTLQESGSYQNNWIVTSGVEEGDEVIVDNLRKISEGVEVKPVPVAFVDGVIKDAESAGKDANAATPEADAVKE